MNNIAHLDSVQHADLRIDADATFREDRNERFVQTVIAEFPLLAAYAPILLAKDSETGAFYCGVMLGIDPGESLFAGPSTRTGFYRPLNIQRVPFFHTETGLAVDLDHPHAGRGDRGELLFDESGAPTPYVINVLHALRLLRSGIEETKSFIAALLALKLVEPVTVELSFDDSTKRTLEDLYTVSQDRLRDLPDAAVIDLFRRNYLQPAYLLAASLNQIPHLARRKNAALAAGGAS